MMSLAPGRARGVSAPVALPVCVLVSFLTREAASIAVQQGPRLKFIEDPIVGVREIPGPSMPDFGVKHVLDLAKYPNAKCLDGTPGAYYFSSGHNAVTNGRRKFYVFKMGGASCFSYEQCYQRSHSMLGSSSEAHGWGMNLDLHSYESAPHIGLNRDQMQNPLMWDWNHVFVIYCDGAYFSGSNSTPTYVGDTQLFFNGADIMSAVMYDLAEKYGLHHAEDVVIGGCASGALSTYSSLDSMAAHPMLPRTARVAGLSCSGFFADIDTWWSMSKVFPYHVQNMSGAISRACQRDRVGDPHKCLVPDIGAAYIRTPFFMWESQYDQYQLLNQYDQECWDTDCAQAHANRVMAGMQRVIDVSPHAGAFISSCAHHCEESDVGDIANLSPIRGSRPMVAFAKWYSAFFKTLTDASLAENRLWYHNTTFPCPECCPQGKLGPRKVLVKGLE